jgi:hypothetical protein
METVRSLYEAQDLRRSKWLKDHAFTTSEAYRDGGCQQQVEKPITVSAPPDPPASRHGLCSHRPHRLPPFGRVKALGPLYVFVVV